MPLPPDADGSNVIQQEALHLLALIEEASAEVQAEVCSRLLASLAARMTAAQATKAIAGARTDLLQGPASAGKTRGRTSKAPKEDSARLDSQLSLLPDPTDPILAWHHFGASETSLLEVLRQEPLGSLEAMLRHDHMPPGRKPRGKSRQALAEAISQRMGEHFGKLV